MSRRIKKYGWIPDLPDHRDHLYAAPQPVLAKLPKKVDRRSSCPHVFNQGELGSCTANVIAAARQFDQMKQGKLKVFTPSRLFIYYNERETEGTVNQDSGAMIRDGIKSLVKQGAAPETSWPYVIAKFAAKPLKKCYDAGLSPCQTAAPKNNSAATPYSPSAMTTPSSVLSSGIRGGGLGCQGVLHLSLCVFVGCQFV